MNKKYFKLILLLFIIITAYAQFSAPENLVTTRIIPPAKQFARQSSYPIILEVDIRPGWHINSNQPLENFLIPTRLNFTKIPGITFGNVHYQKPELKKFSFSKHKMSVYEGKIYIISSLTIVPDYDNDSLKIEISLNYQACNNKSCLAPNQAKDTAIIQVIDQPDLVEQTNRKIFDTILAKFEDSESEESDKGLADILSESGIFYFLIFIFIGGLALNLTPCVYPLIPITVSYFAGQSQGGKGGLLIRAVLYILGMAVMYSILGVVAALTGSLFGSALQHPLVLIFIACVMVTLALSMFGLYEIRVPQKLALIGGKSRSGYLGTLFMGLTVGLIAAPCIGPFVIGLLTFVSEKGDPVAGFWFFFVLALGLGTPFLILGISSGAINKLPRSGIWMVWVREIFGFILIGMAIYFLEPFFPGEKSYIYTLALLSIISGIYLGWIDKSTGKKGFIIIKKLIAILFILLGILVINPFKSQNTIQINWQDYSSEYLHRARKDTKGVIIDFLADWCIPCKELDKFTFSDKKIIDESKKYIMLKADMSLADKKNKLWRQYNIKGMPTVIFLNPDGKEIERLRLVGFENADNFYMRMKEMESIISQDSGDR